MAHADHAAPARRPALEVADILRARADTYGAEHPLSSRNQRVVDDLTRCRTAVLGGFSILCDHVGSRNIQA